MAYENEDDSGAILNGALSIRDLVNDGATFEINSDFNTKTEDDLFPELETGEEEGHIYYEPILSPWEKDYDDLKLLMTKLPDYNIYKKIVKPGTGIRVMPDKARVTIHFNAYWEKESLAFDSTYMRGAPKVFTTNQQEILPGLELSVQTMREGEESQFLISHELLFGEMGCPPRIKPKATGLFIVQLIRFSETGDENAIETVTQEDRRKYSVIIPKVREVHMRGMDLFKQGYISNACKMFHKALTTLECCNLSNKEEQDEQQLLIVRLYTNLAVCYNKMNLPKKTCLMCNEIARISNINKNCKALFQEGRAMIKLGEFTRARHRLIQAQKLEPTNCDIAAELKVLDARNTKYVSNEREIWQRAFGNQTSAKESSPSNGVSKAFQESISTYLDNFIKNDKVRHAQLPEGLSNEEISSFETLIKDFNVKLQIEVDHRSNTVYKLVKQK